MTLPCLGQPGRLGLRELPATPVVLNLWASWCLPCREEMPEMQRVHRAAGDGALFLGVNTQDSEGAAGSFVQDFGVTYPSLFDPKAVLLGQLASPGLPVTLVIAADGRIVDRVIGRIRQDRLVRALAQAGVRVDQAVLSGERKSG